VHVLLREACLPIAADLVFVAQPLNHRPIDQMIEANRKSRDFERR
jgi:hypothetical protein